MWSDGSPDPALTLDLTLLTTHSVVRSVTAENDRGKSIRDSLTYCHKGFIDSNFYSHNPKAHVHQDWPAKGRCTPWKKV